MRGDMADEFGFIQDGIVEKFDDCGDGFAEPVIGYSYNDGVANGVVRLQGFLDLLWEDLLSAGVDAHRSATQQREGAVYFEKPIVARVEYLSPLMVMNVLAVFTGSL